MISISAGSATRGPIPLGQTYSKTGTNRTRSWRELLDLVELRLALLLVGLEGLLLVERVDVGIAAVGVGPLTWDDLRHPRGGVAVEPAAADTHAPEFLRGPRREEGRALHRPHAEPDADGPEVAHDRFAAREVWRDLMQLSGVEPVGVPGLREKHRD